MGGANPMSWTEMTAWQQITGHEVEPWEADVLRAIDRAYLAHVAERQRAEAPTRKGKVK